MSGDGAGRPIPRRVRAIRWTVGRVARAAGPKRVGGVALRAAALTTPTPEEVLGNHLRGVVLFGSPYSSISAHHWERFPTRAIITSETVHVPKRMRPIQRRTGYEVRFDEDFERIISSCRRDGESWITEEVVDLYRRLHALGFVATVGTYLEGRLVGGLWGLEIARTFSIMSVFHLAAHAGTVAQVGVFDRIGPDGRWDLVESGQLNEHYARFGARSVPTERFCELLMQSLAGSMEARRDAAGEAGPSA